MQPELPMITPSPISLLDIQKILLQQHSLRHKVKDYCTKSKEYQRRILTMRNILFWTIIIVCCTCIFNLKAEKTNNTAKKEDGITFKILRILNDNDNVAVIISVFNTGENKITLHIPSSAKEFWSQCHIDNVASYDKKSVIGTTTLKEKYDTITLEPSQGFFYVCKSDIDNRYSEKNIAFITLPICDSQGKIVSSLSKLSDLPLLEIGNYKKPQNINFIDAIIIAYHANLLKYDSESRIMVKLKDNIYLVTFPSEKLPPGTAGGDFAARITIDANSGTILSVMAGS